MPETERESLHLLPIRVAWLVNYIAPYSGFMFKRLQGRFKQFRVFVSVSMGANRHWPVQWDGLNVSLQRTVTRKTVWRHPNGFAEANDVYIPYDTLPLLWSYKPDVVISSELGLRTLQSALYRMAHPASRLIVGATLSDLTEQGRGKAREVLRSALLSRCDAVIVNGRSGADYIRRFSVPETKLFRIPSTTDLTPFRSSPLSRDCNAARRLLYVGSLAERKGLLPFMELLFDWANTNLQQRVELWLVGDGPLRSKLEGLATPSNVSVRFWGNVSYDTLPEIYAQAGLFVFPTLADEWGMVINEALAAGLPVVGSVYSQAVEEIVADGVNGWTFRPDNPVETLSALSRALSCEDASLERMRLSARESIEHITPEFVADQITSAVRSVLGWNESGEEKAFTVAEGNG